jgi:hypothetical protein
MEEQLRSITVGVWSILFSMIWGWFFSFFLLMLAISVLNFLCVYVSCS